MNMRAVFLRARCAAPAGFILGAMLIPCSITRRPAKVNSAPQYVTVSTNLVPSLSLRFPAGAERDY
jgi:hypothetical protein